MTNIEKLALEIMSECEADGEPVTKEEAIKMAEMELNAKDNRRYEKTDKPKKEIKKVRKIDKEKEYLLSCIKNFIVGLNFKTRATNIVMKNETEISFDYNNNSYTIKLIKHRKKT